MAIEVKELLIKVKVESNTSSNNKESSSTVQPSSAFKKKMVDECVAKVMKKLERKGRR